MLHACACALSLADPNCGLLDFPACCGAKYFEVAASGAIQPPVNATPLMSAEGEDSGQGWFRCLRHSRQCQVLADSRKALEDEDDMSTETRMDVPVPVYSVGPHESTPTSTSSAADAPVLMTGPGRHSHDADGRPVRM